MKPLTITIIQAELKWEDKRANLSMFTEKIEQLQIRTELVILPEMFTTGFSMQPEKLAEPMDGQSVQWMKDIAVKKRIAITGSLIIEENEKYFNRLIWVLPDGSFGYYDKRHLFGYAQEDRHYAAGSRRLIASLKGWKINLQICYDLRFPVWARQSKSARAEQPEEPEYDLLIYVANWPERRGHAWRTLLQARAIENQCYVAGVNRTGEDGNDIHYRGDSMIVDPMGTVLYSSEDREEVFTHTLDGGILEETRARLPFLKDADAFTIMK